MDNTKDLLKALDWGQSYITLRVYANLVTKLGMTHLNFTFVW